MQQEARLRESVDLTATINNYNQSQLPEMIALIVDPSTTQSVNFGQNMMRRVRNYVRQLIAIIVHCCQDGNQGFDTIVQSCVVSKNYFGFFFFKYFVIKFSHFIFFDFSDC